MSNGWTSTAPCAPPTVYLPIPGGTMTGPLILAADPVQNLEAVTKQYVDAEITDQGGIGDNRIINGNFAVNQRSFVSGTALPANGYGHDRWKAGAGGCTYTFTTALPDTTITITANTLTQIIEAGMIEGGIYTLSWTGTAQARVYQGTPTGAYAASPLITAALPAGANTIVEFNTGTVTRVKLEIGSIATPFNRQSLAKSLADCQRYYQTYSNVIVAGNSVAGTGIFETITFPSMRAQPTVVFGTISYDNASTLTTSILDTNFTRLQAVVTASGYGLATAPMQLSAEL